MKKSLYKFFLPLLLLLAFAADTRSGMQRYCTEPSQVKELNLFQDPALLQFPAGKPKTAAPITDEMVNSPLSSILFI